MSRIFAAAALVASASAMRSGNGTGNVPVALYSESKCPDCAAFAPTFDAVWKLDCVPAMVSTYEEVPYGNAETAPDGTVTCQHGPSECQGNMLEACAIAHSPGMEWLDFITCMYAGYRSVPANGQSCAAKAKLNWATLTKCFGGGTGTEGKALIAANAARTNALNPSHQYVPWLVVNGTLVPSPQTGGPSQAKVLAAICGAYTGTAPSCCTAESLAALEAAHPAPPSQGRCVRKA